MNKRWGQLANKMGTVVEDIVAPSVRQLKAEGESATLVRGRDDYGHFGQEPLCTRDFAPDNVAFQAEAERLKHEVYDSP